MKEELLRAADKGCVTVDKFKKFNDDLPKLGDKMMYTGLCNYYEIIAIGGKLLTLRLNVKHIKFDEIPEDRKRCAQGLFNEFLEDHDITKQECEDTCFFLMLCGKLWIIRLRINLLNLINIFQNLEKNL